MDANPWLRLPTEPPCVLPEDREAVEAFNRAHDPTHKHFLHVDKLLPEPFVGAADAPLVLLSNNPGFSEREEKHRSRQAEGFRDLMRRNLNHATSDWPFVYFHPDFAGSGKQWWGRKLKHLIKRFGEEVVARSVLNVVYFPYPSRRFGHKRLRLPSQQYGFDLVRDAVGRNAAIVLMRPGKRDAWLEAVPQLKGYARFFSVKNPQTPVISPKNCAGYSEAERAIENFAKARGWKTGEEHAADS